MPLPHLGVFANTMADDMSVSAMQRAESAADAALEAELASEIDETAMDLMKFAIGGRQILADAHRSRREESLRVVETVKVATRGLGNKVRQARANAQGAAQRAGTSLADTLGGLEALADTSSSDGQDATALATTSSGDGSSTSSAIATQSARSIAATPAAPLSDSDGKSDDGAWRLDSNIEHERAWMRAKAFLVASDSHTDAEGVGSSDRVPQAPKCVLLVQLASLSGQRVAAKAMEMLRHGKEDVEMVQEDAMMLVPSSLVDRVANRWKLAHAVGLRTGQPAAALAAAVGGSRWLARTLQLRKSISAARDAASLAEAMAYGPKASTLTARQRKAAIVLGSGALHEAAALHRSLGEESEARVIASMASHLARESSSSSAAVVVIDDARVAVSASKPSAVAVSPAPAEVAVASTAVVPSSESALPVEDALRKDWTSVTHLLDQIESSTDDKSALRSAREKLCRTHPGTGATVLMAAAADGQMDLINRLSAAGCADVYARDKAGCTAVWWALNLSGEGAGARGMQTSLTIACLISPAIQLPIPNPAAMLPLGPPPLSRRETLRLLPPPTDSPDGTATATAGAGVEGSGIIAAGAAPLTAAAAEAHQAFYHACMQPRAIAAGRAGRVSAVRDVLSGTSVTSEAHQRAQASLRKATAARR